MLSCCVCLAYEKMVVDMPRGAMDRRYIWTWTLFSGVLWLDTPHITSLCQTLAPFLSLVLFLGPTNMSMPIHRCNRYSLRCFCTAHVRFADSVREEERKRRRERKEAVKKSIAMPLCFQCLFEYDAYPPTRQPQCAVGPISLEGQWRDDGGPGLCRLGSLFCPSPLVFSFFRVF